MYCFHNWTFNWFQHVLCMCYTWNNSLYCSGKCIEALNHADYNVKYGIVWSQICIMMIYPQYTVSEYFIQACVSTLTLWVQCCTLLSASHSHCFQPHIRICWCPQHFYNTGSYTSMCSQGTSMHWKDRFHCIECTWKQQLVSRYCIH